MVVDPFFLRQSLSVGASGTDTTYRVSMDSMDGMGSSEGNEVDFVKVREREKAAGLPGTSQHRLVPAGRRLALLQGLGWPCCKV